MTRRRTALAVTLATTGYGLILTQVGATNPRATFTALGLVLCAVAVVIARHWLDRWSAPVGRYDRMAQVMEDRNKH